MNKILFATDFSESCNNAMHYLLKLIENSSAVVDIVHVYDIPVTSVSTLPYQAVKGMLDERKQVVVKQLSDIKGSIPSQHQGETHAIYGIYPSSDIAECAAKTNAELVVMGLRQKYSLIDKMIGSITAHTMHKSPVPVLAIPSGSTFEKVEHILFPTAMDHINGISDDEYEAMEWLLSIRSFLQNPKIHLLHINATEEIEIAMKNGPLPHTDFTMSYADSVDEGIKDHLESHTTQWLAFYKPHRSFWEQLYHSSVSRKLLYHSRLPILIFS